MTGRVQGVGFRYHTVHVASRLGIKGWVRNASDGSVEVLAEGDRESLASFERYLHEGPSYAVVTSVEVRRPVETGVYRSFRVEY